MSRDEYIEKREELKRQLADLKDEYVRTNSPIAPNTKVKLTSEYTDGEKYGILVGYECVVNNVVPIVMKMKKDGTAHSVSKFYTSAFTKVEPIK